MNEKELRYIEAAFDVFARYGVRRTTMGEIAEQAGVSRQTLYASYANKEEILAAAMRHAMDKTVTAIEADWATIEDIGDKLDVYFHHAVIVYFELIRSMPDANDLIAGIGDAAIAERERGEEAKRAALATLFEPYESALEASGTSSADLADFVQTSTAGFKYTATDLNHMRRLLGALKSAALSLLGES